MKLTNKQALDLLKSIGLADAELVADDAADPEYKQDIAISLVDVSRTPIISQKVLADKNLEIHTAITGKVYGGLRKQLSKLTGIPTSELEGKDGNEMAELAISHLNKIAGGDKEVFATQLKDVMTAHEKSIDKIKKDAESERDVLTEKLTQTQILEKLQDVYKTAKGISPDANIPILSADFLNSVKQAAIIKIADDGTIELWDKANPSVRLMNETKTTFANVGDMLKGYHAPRGQWNEDTRKVNAEQQMKNRLDLNTSVSKDGRIESPEAKQQAMVEAWANEGLNQ